MNRQHKFLLLFCDIFLFIGSVLVIAYLRDSGSPDKVFLAPGLWFMTFIVLSLLYIFGGYDISHSTSTSKLVARPFVAILISLAVVISVHYFGQRDRAGIFGRGTLIGSMLAFGILSSIARAWVSLILHQSLEKAEWLFIATRNLYEKMMEDFNRNPFRGQVFFILDEVQAGDGKNVAGSWTDLSKFIHKKWSSIVIALKDDTPDDIIEKLVLARFESNAVKDLVSFYEEIWQKVPIYYLGPRWFLLTQGFVLLGNPIRLRLKRLMDVLISFFFLIITFPFMILTALAVRLDSPGPAIYKQVRTGRDGKPFVIYKFRSMRTDAEKDGAKWASENDSRITRVGNFIRKTRLDELPQFFNILEGSMSFVGPRPERPEFVQSLEKQLPFYELRHIVQPGLTGWAQVLYPYGASLEDAKEKLQYDLFYIKNYSLWMDISIILKTITVVVFGRGR